MKKIIPTDELTRIIYDYPEQSKFDWKRNINISSDKAKAEIAKDVISIANAHGTTNGYIIYGINPQLDNPFLGISTSIDDATIQQIVNSKINKPIEFIYYEQKVKKVKIGILVIEKEQIRPFMVTKDCGVLKKGTIPIRRGSSSSLAIEHDMQMMFSDYNRIDNIQNKISYIQKAILNDAPATHIITEYLDLMKIKMNQKEIEWCMAEIKGYDEKLNKELVEELGLEYRRVNGYLSITDIHHTGILSFDQVRLQEPDYFWELRFFFHMPIFELESIFLSKSELTKMTIPSKPLVKQGLPEIFKQFDKLFFYYNPIEIQKTIAGIKQRILSKIISL